MTNRRKMSLQGAVLLLMSAAPVTMHARQVGVWNFDNNLNNAIPGRAAMNAEGGWTPAYVNETIGGSPATVLTFPAFTDTQALDMPNQAGPNGPNTPGSTPSKNNWSIVMDVKFPAAGDYTSLWETGAIGGNDGDYFVRAFDGLGIAQQYGGTINPSDWNRVAVTVDSAVVPGTYTVTGYVNGVPTGVVATTDVAPGGREAIRDVLHLFADNDFETSAGFVNSVAYYGEVLSGSAVGALGGPSAAGVPTAANQTGLWQFNDNLNNSVVSGSPMAAVGGWTPSYATETINGSSARVLSFPAFDNTQALDMPNQATPDAFAVPPGPPADTNVWTIVMDVKFPVIDGFTSLFETNTTLNTTDADYFIRGDFDGIGTSGQYGGSFLSNTWTRIAVTIDGSLSDQAYVVNGYIDGFPVGTAFTSTSPDGKEAVRQFLHLFADEDGENAAGLVNSVAFYDELLTEEAIGLLGGASAGGIPVTVPPLDADFNNDGLVTGADFLIWQRGFGLASGATNSQGDADADGAVGATDLSAWRLQYGGSPSVAALAGVPEPTTATLAFIAGGAALGVALRRQLAAG